MNIQSELIRPNVSAFNAAADQISPEFEARVVSRNEHITGILECDCFLEDIRKKLGLFTETTRKTLDLSLPSKAKSKSKKSAGKKRKSSTRANKQEAHDAAPLDNQIVNEERSPSDKLFYTVDFPILADTENPFLPRDDTETSFDDNDEDGFGEVMRAIHLSRGKASDSGSEDEQLSVEPSLQAQPGQEKEEDENQQRADNSSAGTFYLSPNPASSKRILTQFFSRQYKGKTVDDDTDDAKYGFHDEDDLLCQPEEEATTTENATTETPATVPPILRPRPLFTAEKRRTMCLLRMAPRMRSHQRRRSSSGSSTLSSYSTLGSYTHHGSNGSSSGSSNENDNHKNKTNSNDSNESAPLEGAAILGSSLRMLMAMNHHHHTSKPTLHVGGLHEIILLDEKSSLSIPRFLRVDELDDMATHHTLSSCDLSKSWHGSEPSMVSSATVISLLGALPGSIQSNSVYSSEGHDEEEEDPTSGSDSLDGRSVATLGCNSCKAVVHYLSDATMVLCPFCRVVQEPDNHNALGKGLTVGFGTDTLFDISKRTSRSSSSRSSE